MTVIIKHLDSGNEYILLNAGLGASKSSLPSRVLNDLFTSDNSDKVMMLVACDVKGRIVWLRSNEIIVTEIDGKKPSEILPEIISTPVQPLLDSPYIEGEEQEQDFNEDFNEDSDEEDEDWI
ncbi:hypothetical protein [Gloeothece verrucosa]|uniref:Uncharacterized protein n=1 Tax=Gloeothece verrucosa (strain PCC 7822) TaxID=497965 RepID=E0UJX7_GLOV7|nr:hypothetical protein [Gloeothece verrucosa]ADN13488.1 conserved hypothetical protein [Gloeothece verrucosa PCC 7822]